MADNAAPMLSRARAGGFVRGQWPPLVALVATLAYAVLVIGFGLDFRPLHNDEGVTLGVASRPSARDVLRVAVDVRHGPPLHYLVVHASLLWRDDILGLRLPSAVFGIVAVAVSYGFGRELLGRSGGAIVAVVTASSPITIHLGQFARGYTAMIVGRLCERMVDAGAGADGSGAVGGSVCAGGVDAGLGAPVRVVCALDGAGAVGGVRGGAAAARAFGSAAAGGSDRRGASARRPGAGALAAPVRAVAEQVPGRVGLAGDRSCLGPVLAAAGRRCHWLIPRPLRRRPRRGHAARTRGARIPRPARRASGHGVAGAPTGAARGAHRGVHRFCSRAAPLVPASRLCGCTGRIRARAAPPHRCAVRGRGLPPR